MAREHDRGRRRAFVEVIVFNKAASRYNKPLNVDILISGAVGTKNERRKFICGFLVWRAVTGVKKNVSYEMNVADLESTIKFLFYRLITGAEFRLFVRKQKTI